MFALLCPLFLLTPPATAATVTLPESPPQGFVLDGDPSEWTRAPDLNLGPAEQLSGDPSTPDDYSARIWWSADLDGLVLAVDVTDDAVLFAPRGMDPNFGDHVSLWIAMPPADLPPIAVVTDAGEMILRGPTDCNNQSAFADVEACKAWFGAQPPRRARLSHLFVRQYELTLGEVMESWSGSCAAVPSDNPSPTQATCKSSKVVLKKNEHGYSLEARIGLADFPATHVNPMTHLLLLVDAVDNDQGHDALEATYASSKTADPNRPATLPRYDLLRPPLFDSVPPVFAATELLDSAPGLFYYPSVRLSTAYVLENVLQPAGAPPPASPQITTLDWSKPRRLGVLNDVDLYEVPGDGAPCLGCGPGRRLIFVSEDVATSAEDLGQGVVGAVVPRGEVLHLFVTEISTAGGVTTHTIRVLQVADGADVTEVFRQSLSLGAPQDGYTYTAISEQIVPDGSAFGLVGKRIKEGSAEKPKDFMLLNVWNPETGAYELDPLAK